MGKTKHVTHLGATLIMCIVGVLLAAVWLPSATHAAPAALPPRPTTQPPSPMPIPAKLPAGAYIALRVPSASEGLWTVVQWQGAFGDWHDVEGWRGSLPELYVAWGRQIWWLGSEHFGTGPFCWLVYDGPDGELLATSESFYMPQSSGEVVRVEVSLQP